MFTVGKVPRAQDRDGNTCFGSRTIEYSGALRFKAYHPRTKLHLKRYAKPLCELYVTRSVTQSEKQQLSMDPFGVLGMCSCT